jgi:hypothetical protein
MFVEIEKRVGSAEGEAGRWRPQKPIVSKNKWLAEPKWGRNR